MIIRLCEANLYLEERRRHALKEGGSKAGGFKCGELANLNLISKHSWTVWSHLEYIHCKL
jgi:hypothetical protein